MSELFTVTKVFILSLVILVLLQTKWNGTSLEKKAIIALHQSEIGQILADTAQGAGAALEKGIRWGKSNIQKALVGFQAGHPREIIPESVEDASEATR